MNQMYKNQMLKKRLMLRNSKMTISAIEPVSGIQNRQDSHDLILFKLSPVK
jgi:hypothetical protein